MCAHLKNTQNLLQTGFFQKSLLIFWDLSTFRGIQVTKKSKFYILVVACISTGAVTMYILDNYDTLSAILALMKLQCSYGRITHISGDAGSNLLEGNINLPLVGEEGKKLFDLMTSLGAPRGPNLEIMSKEELEV